jgi:hypothetical protein
MPFKFERENKKNQAKENNKMNPDEEPVVPAAQEPEEEEDFTTRANNSRKGNILSALLGRKWGKETAESHIEFIKGCADVDEDQE